MNPGCARLIQIAVDGVHIEGMLELPVRADGIVLFAHGSGSSRHSPRNNFVAQVLHEKGMGTLLLDLLSATEELDYQSRFDIGLLTRRLLLVTQWVGCQQEARHLPVGYFGASTGAAAALRAAAALGGEVGAVVSRGGRPDLAGSHDLARVKSPTLLLVGGDDTQVIELNRAAYALLPCTKMLRIIPGATHLFEEPGALEEVAREAAHWFSHHLKTRSSPVSAPAGP